MKALTQIALATENNDLATLAIFLSTLPTGTEVCPEKAARVIATDTTTACFLIEALAAAGALIRLDS